VRNDDFLPRAWTRIAPRTSPSLAWALEIT
jgi:hypothetical protein